LLRFKEKLGEELITVGKVSCSPSALAEKQSSPRSDLPTNQSTPPVAKKCLKLDKIPDDSMRLDKFDHFPVHDEK